MINGKLAHVYVLLKSRKMKRSMTPFTTKELSKYIINTLEIDSETIIAEYKSYSNYICKKVSENQMGDDDPLLGGCDVYNTIGK